MTGKVIINEKIDSNKKGIFKLKINNKKAL